MIAPSVASHACSSMVPPLMPSDTSTSAWAWSLGQENGTGRKTGQVRLLGLGSLRRRSGRAAAWAKGVFESQVRRGAFCPRRAAEWSAAAHAGANRINLRPGLRPVHQGRKTGPLHSVSGSGTLSVSSCRRSGSHPTRRMNFRRPRVNKRTCPVFLPRDLASWARVNGYTCKLWLPSGAPISKPLQRLVDEGLIIIEHPGI